MQATKEKVKEDFQECPYCGCRNISQDKNGIRICLSCFEQWDDEGIL